MAKALTDIRSLARVHTETCLRTLAGIVREKKAPHTARVSAAQALLDRGWGKPAQAITGDDQLDPIKVISEIRHVIVESGHADDKDSEDI